jgi:hypothetical protein
MASFYRLALIAFVAASLTGCGGADVKVEMDNDSGAVDSESDGGANTSSAGDVTPTPGTGAADTPAPGLQQTPIDRPNVTADEQARIDAWLTAYADSLNDYGDPEGTMYAGGTPLFNEQKGEPVSKYEYIVAKHPEKPWNEPLPTNRPTKPAEKKDTSK